MPDPINNKALLNVKKALYKIIAVSERFLNNIPLTLYRCPEALMSAFTRPNVVQQASNFETSNDLVSLATRCEEAKHTALETSLISCFRLMHFRTRIDK